MVNVLDEANPSVFLYAANTKWSDGKFYAIIQGANMKQVITQTDLNTLHFTHILYFYQITY
jgi:hypothetical protein